MQYVNFRVMVLGLCLAVAACGGGGGGGSSDAATGGGPVGGSGGGSGSGTGGGAAVEPTIERNLGLVSGGTGLVTGSGGVDRVSLVGVSGTGLVVGVSGTGLSAGAIQDFGSIILNDERLATDTASVFIEGVASTEAELRQGQQVLVIGDTANGVATGVYYRANIVAPLTNLVVEDADLGLALGRSLEQAVEFDASTVYENTEFELLSDGTLYEFSGIVEDDELLLVTFVRPAPSSSDYRLLGQVRDLANGVFTIGGLQIDATAATLVDFDDGVIESGDAVAVTINPADYDAATQSALARQVTLLPRLLLADTAAVEVEGVIDFFDSPMDFDVQNQPVTVTAATEFLNGDVDDLALDQRVVVEGVIDASGILVAAEILFESDDTVFVAGPLDSVDIENELLTVFGVTLDLRDLVDLDEVDSLEELQTGDLLEVVGYVDGEMPVAAEVELDVDLEAFELRGPVREISAGTGTFSVFGIAIVTDAVATEFAGLDEEELTQAEFFQQLEAFNFVEIRWAPGQTAIDVPVAVALVDD